MRFAVVAGLSLVGVVALLVTDAQSMPRRVVASNVDDSAVRAAATRAVELMQQSQVTWRKAQTCASCHHVLEPQIPLQLARERGVAVDERIFRETDVAALSYLGDFDLAVQRTDYVDVFFDGWALVAAHDAGLKPGPSTSAYSQFIAAAQRSDGSWLSTDGRPPQAYSPFSATAICAKAIGMYLPSALEGERSERMRRAREWLARNKPRDTEDRAYQLLGLKWTGASKAACSDAARQLLLEQHEDGGWSELSWRASDAYSTGLALYALYESGELLVRDRAYQRGVRWLLDTQMPDGSWHVASRLHPPAPVSPPYFESGFPYGHDQFVSMMGTTWAATALLQTLPVLRGSGGAEMPLAGVGGGDRVEWIEVALNGNARELARLLDKGLDPNVKTAQGTSALMLAARDLDKVKLLVARGADVNAAALTGITPLMVAAHFHGNVETVRLLLASGAKPNSPPGVEVRNEASAVFFGLFARDPAIVRVLLDAGAERDKRMKVLGMTPLTPLAWVASSGDDDVLACLVEHGVDPNASDDSGVSALGWAAIYNRVAAVDVLIRAGANVNFVDGFGMTPAMYAASVDFGDSAVLKRLIAAGADLGVKNREGRRASDLARGYGHVLHASVLSAGSGAR